FDTMVAAFVLDPIQTSFKLDTLVFKLLGHNMIPITDLIGKGRDQLRMDQVPLDHICEYAAEDADFTWRLKVLFEPLLRASDVGPLFYETEMPLVSVLTDMEAAGINIDDAFLKSMSERLHKRTAEIIDDAHREAKVAFNLDSPKQLSEVLFDKLNMRVVRRTKTTRSTDADTLETLYRETNHELLKLLLEYRELQKLLGTYVDALPQSRSKRTSRIHTSFHQTGAITGRLSSSDPNLQNIPIRTEAGREVRRAFIPRTPDERLIVADYSQVELRVLAHYCGDEELIRAFTEDRDIHAFVASQVNNVPLDAVSKEMRSRAKAVNFGLIYGQGAFGLAQQTGMSQTEARAFIDDYFRRYPRIRGFIDQCIEDARRDGFVRTIQGRKRPILDIDSRNKQAKAQAERLSVNTVIQGSAADLIKTAMIQLSQRIAGEKLPLRMLLQVHDELVLESPRGDADAMAGVVKSVMAGAIPLRVPLGVDVHVADNWLDAK
ncbi:MAG: DNA polymerase, partial [Phycisphaerae bacterium]